MLGRCKHFNGRLNDACKAGVVYESLRGGDKSVSLPCLEEYNTSGTKCDKCEYPTPEEVAEDEKEMKKHMEDVMTARKAIVTACGGPWKKGTPGTSGTTDCPVCSTPGSLRYSRAGYNGHVHAACTTDGCVSWME